ncbi:Uu.00g047030.m01.CDS01 [Anthostomella pinea]|uniref:Uu.00g047030.m01.CDS01 n=1 Tax=Anthostomella pinea TaxID=933095 RepID=A0AAI8VCF3_9PEZI|nr:Uu.00g047030.m01.CDS01 [Anthostomella pinea]
MTLRPDGRLTFQEAMSLAPLPSRAENGQITRRYMSRRSAWVTGADLKIPQLAGANAFGGHVYSQAGMAAAAAFAEMQAANKGVRGDKKFGLHTMHGFFSEPGRTDRPFIYEVETVAANASFPNLLVTARQPLQPSTNPARDNYPPADADLPLGPVCFNALISFRPSGISQYSASEPPPQTRFASILNSRPASSWEPTPLTDIAGIVATVPTRTFGTFPGLDLRKVDLEFWNEGKPLHERRELILYRAIAPLPAADANAHILAHAYEADRNGLLMVGNHAGFGFDFARAASLSYSFVVHVNAADATMQQGDGEDDEWWIQEASFPRVEAGRGIVMSKIWSPRGVHVATEYQDGIIQRAWKPGEREGKL